MHRVILAILLAISLVACQAGAPARYDSQAACASRQAVIPAQTFGFHPAVRQGIGIPVETAKCLSGFLTRGIADAFQTADCVLDSLIPIVTPAPQSAPQFVEVEETYMETETRLVPRTRKVQKQLVPVQSAPCAPTQRAAPCAPPAPQRAPGCEPVATCDGQNCSLRGR